MKLEMETLKIAEKLLIEDLQEYIPKILLKSAKKKPILKDDPHPQQDFFKYLVSVASHTIGLRASVEPFNSREEDMLNYLVEMFDINDFDRLKKILLSHRESEARKNRVDKKKLAEIIRARRRHSWRPELRIRIKPPTFYYREAHYINNLSVRVYLFRKDELSNLKHDELEDNTTQDSKNQRTVLRSIFKTSRIDSSHRIRPVSEMKSLVEFEQSSSSKKNDQQGAESGHKMVHIIDGERIDGDVFLKIKRRHCEPDPKYILRFEFWLNSKAVEANLLDQYRRYLKRFVYNGTVPCSSQKKSIYQNEDQEFYGYVNYKLDELPSHAIKLDKPIVTLQSRRINNCEICIEPRNRRLETDDKDSTKAGPIDSARVVPNQSLIINHIRLYANCFLYHSVQLLRSKGESLVDSYTMENITIDNLFYMSAQTLINQHRLQSNITKSGDQSLRRIAFLLLINGLQTKFGGYEDDSNIILNLLISLTKNEYSMAGKVIDDKTLQKLDPFIESAPSHTSNLMVEMEMAELRRFFLLTLRDRVKKCFLPLHPKDDLNRIVTLAGLTMFRKALSHHERLSQIHTQVKNLRYDVVQLRDFITKVLFGLAEKHFRLRFEALLKRETNRDELSAEQSSYRWSERDSDNDSWPVLLRDIRGLSNDLYLYWSKEGIDSLEASEQRVSKQMNMMRNAERKNLENLIRLKIDDFLG